MHVNASILRSEDLTGQLIQRGQRANTDRGEALIATRPLQTGSPAQKIGAWTSTPGGWTIENRPDAETFFVLDGHATITPTGRDSFDVGPGDLVHLPVGWTGRWDVTETMRKIYVIVEPSSPNTMELSS